MQLITHIEATPKFVIPQFKHPLKVSFSSHRSSITVLTKTTTPTSHNMFLFLIEVFLKKIIKIKVSNAFYFLVFVEFMKGFKWIWKIGRFCWDNILTFFMWWNYIRASRLLKFLVMASTTNRLQSPKRSSMSQGKV